MKSFGLTLALAALLAVGLANTAAGSGAATNGLAVTSLVKAKPAKAKPAKAKALRKCRKHKRASKRKVCVKRVNRKFAKPKPAPSEVAARVDVRDDYFSPSQVNVKTGQSVLWVWEDRNHDPHNINLISGPPGVKRMDYQTPGAPGNNYRFTRPFKVPGTYNFSCNLHHLMNMTVEVSK
ncbi:MAG: plastocyanin/azurin family copper-binding protein [Actinomycetota bacterium]|nr:plastocyanin/azurin family copper-binding protein [Actinomycetota bacterium]